MIVMDVRGGDAQSLRARAAILLGQVMITHSDVYGISGSYDAEKSKMTLLSLASYGC